MSDSSAAPTATIEIISDVVCPWCYIGRHRLERSLELVDPALSFEVRWRPFELNPGLPPGGMDRRAYCEAKFGSVERARQLYDKMTQNAAADGLPMDVGRINRTPNTRAAHRLIELAADHGCQDAVVDALFQAYFVDGRDVGDVDELAAIGASAGLDQDAVATALSACDSDDVIEAHEATAEAMGVHGVPAFVYNGRLLFSGAQSPETIARALERAAAKGL